ncbi:MAG: HAD hydrolase family protein [Bacteroidetes bacterium]|nr:HAD hydrolase family protein [Bacteroidota bacterium]
MLNQNELYEKLSQIKLFVMDVDGTLTDGGIYYSVEGLQLKKFCVYDGMGISLLNQSNINTMIMSSDDSEIPLKRAEKIKITYSLVGVKRKKTALLECLETLNISIDEVAFIGDDINDIELLEICGFSACPSNAMDIVKEKVNYVCNKKGGEGAVREVCDMILLAKNYPITLQYE